MSAFAQSDEQNVLIGNKGNQMLGVRFGVHSFTTNEEGTFEDLDVNTSTDVSFAAEFYFNYFLVDKLGMELSLGSAHRGEVVFRDSNSALVSYGSANVYPMSVGLKATPLSGWVSDHYQPFFLIGGSLVVARRIFETGDLGLYAYGTESETDFGWFWGAGFESYISHSICVSSSFKQYSIDYSDYIAGYKDHSGWQIIVGIAYIWRQIQFD